jgi:hypothetical protein
MKTLFAALPCALLLAIISSGDLYAGEKRFSVGFQIGPFIPQDWRIQGTQEILWITDDFVSSATVSGFGHGLDIIVYGEYWPSRWGLRLESGGRILSGRKIDVITPYGPIYYESHLVIYPVSLSFIYRVESPSSDVTPYIGAGTGFIISYSDQEYSLYSDVFRLEQFEGKSTAMSFHFLSGFEYAIFPAFPLLLEFRYDFAPSDMRLDRVDSEIIRKLEDINMGGTSLRIGAAFRF